MNYNSYCNMASEIVFPCLIKTCDYLDGVLFELTRVHSLQDISADMLRKKIKMDNMEVVITATRQHLNQIITFKYDLADSISYLEKHKKESAKNVFSKLNQNKEALHLRPVKSQTYMCETELVGYTIDCYKTIRAATEICQSLDHNELTALVFGWLATQAVPFFPVCL